MEKQPSDRVVAVINYLEAELQKMKLENITQIKIKLDSDDWFAQNKPLMQKEVQDLEEHFGIYWHVKQLFSNKDVIIILSPTPI